MSSNLYPNTRESAEETKQRAWREYGVLVAALDQNKLTWEEREFLKQIGSKLYGPRRDERRNDRG